jgi:hypothetical protein
MTRLTKRQQEARARKSVCRRRDLKAGDLLLVGRLGPTVPGHSPVLKVWCPFCHRHHEHGFRPDTVVRADTVEFRGAHCTQGPLAFGGAWHDSIDGYYVGLEPKPKR